MLNSMFSETGDISSVRVMALLCVLAAILIALIGMYKGSDLMGLSALCGVFLGAAFGGKVMQKKSETPPC